MPRARESDVEDVRWALSVAATLIDGADPSEALKWLRRAAEVASDHDDDARATELLIAAGRLAGATADRRSKNDEPTPAPAPAIAQTLTSPESPTTGSAKVTLREAYPSARPREKLTRALDAIGLRFHDPGEDTVVQPATRVRRALMALDPDYARRTELDDASAHDDEARGDGLASVAVDGGTNTSASPHASTGAGSSAGSRASAENVDRGASASAENVGRGVDFASAVEINGAAAIGSPSDAGAAYDEENTPRSSRAEWAPSRRTPSPAGRREGPVSHAEPSTARRASLPLSGLPNALPAFRVIVVAIPDESDVRIMFLADGSEAPPGAAVALLVPTSPEDAQRLMAIYATCDAKL
ncbi:MAG: hypothetical protein EXR75_10920 [Myxococcales bacterium]|nr:hypothetical protein [Myxococcales bacterium]